MKHIGIKVARDNLHTILNEIKETNEPVTIDRMGEPIATIIPSKDYELILKAIALIKMGTETLPTITEKKEKIKMRDLYGSLKPAKPITDWEKAEEIAKEEHFTKKS